MEQTTTNCCWLIHEFGNATKTHQGQQNEVMRIVCEADSGSFTLSFRGVTSADIPFDASYGYVEELLEAMGTVADVEVSMLNSAEAVCGQSQEVVTEVEFLQDFGDLPAALIRCGSFAAGYQSGGV